MTKLYYTPPADKHFDEVKKAAIQLWQTYDDEFGYASEKVKRIQDIKNVEDNFMYMVAMFDPSNQRKLSDLLTDDTKFEIRNRMIDGGHPLELIYF